MSIRIHKLAEELGLDNKEMMTLLKERKIIPQDVKSVSSTVDNINASALRDEFAAKIKAAAPAPVAVAAPAAPAVTDRPSETATTAAETPGAAPKVAIPAGVFVKSKSDIDREREVAAAAKAAALKAPTPPPAPVMAKAPAPLPPRPVAPAAPVSRPPV